MRRLTIAATLALSALAWAATAHPASAQLSSQGGPISYSADNLEYYEDEHRLVLTGDVDLVQSDARLRSNKLTLIFTPNAANAGQQSGGFGSGDIQKIIAEGDVYYIRPDQSARGNQAVYETASDTVTFTGNVVVQSPDNIIRGDVLTFQIKAGRTSVKPAAGAPGERVRGVFRPKPQAAKPAPAAGGGAQR